MNASTSLLSRLPNYTPLHPNVYILTPSEQIENDLTKAINSGSTESILSLLDQPLFGVFTFNCLKPDFCKQFIEELDHLEKNGVSLKRPNSMNRYGAILNPLGFDHFIGGLLKQYIVPLASILFKEVGGDNLQHYHAFTIRYKFGEDIQLKRHTDDADVTLNICLGKTFTGGKLYFVGVKDSSIQKVPKSLHQFKREYEETDLTHELGKAVLHLGKHIHGANPIESGERVNLIIWCKVTPFS